MYCTKYELKRVLVNNSYSETEISDNLINYKLSKGDLYVREQ